MARKKTNKSYPLGPTSNGPNENSKSVLEFDLQNLLGRRSMSEIWNTLLKAGVLKDPQSMLEGIDSLMPSPGTFPCACCNPLNTQYSGDGDCDAKCQISTASPNDQMEIVSKIINSWTWEKDVGKKLSVIQIYLYQDNYCLYVFRNGQNI